VDLHKLRGLNCMWYKNKYILTRIIILFLVEGKFTNYVSFLFFILLWRDRRILYVDKRWSCDMPLQYFKPVEHSGRRSYINLCVCTYNAIWLVTMSLYVRHSFRRDWCQSEQCQKRIIYTYWEPANLPIPIELLLTCVKDVSYFAISCS
jgi:hypothetical protein